uniref:GTPase IMAP family member 8 n=1 Tax=Amphiprion percula TaxID=161767 RepID=A0A3P8T4X0_AMPPE
IVLLGRTGTGRSSSGNTILGRSAFCVDVSPCSVTTRCMRQTGTVDGRSISVIDTPGFFHTHLSPQEVMEEVGHCMGLSSLGPHVFLVTLQSGRFTQEEREALEWIKARFGSDVTRFTMVLFTWGDQLQGKRAENFLEKSRELSEFVSSCHGGHHTFDNSSQDKTTKEEQSPDLERRRKEEEQRRREEEEDRKRAERLFWCELVTAVGKGAAEGAGIMGKDKGKGKAVKKAKVVEKAAALAASPLSISSAAKAVGGAVKEGSKVLYKHRKMFLR